jgi:SPP1 gp7 family putative phage head morphogenesis protein
MSDLNKTFYLPPSDTVEYFRSKSGTFQIDRWWEAWGEEYAKSFTVTGIRSTNILLEIEASLDKVLAEGGTFEQWKTSILPTLKQAVIDGTAPMSILRDHRLRIIYGTNIRMARAAGKWKRIQQDKELRPFLMYVAILDEKTRPDHARWHGTILPVDHPWWDTHFPPCGWNCRCDVMQLDQKFIDAQDWKISDGPPDDGPDQQFIVRDTGEVKAVPAGIDPGFEYNAGKGHMARMGQQVIGQIEKLAETNIPAARKLLDRAMDETTFTAFLEAPSTFYPIMILNEVFANLLGAKTRVVRLSSSTFAKQKLKHPELKISNYRALANAPDNAKLIIQENNQNIIFIYDQSGRLLRAVVKSTVDGAELYVSTLHYATDRELLRNVAKGQVIYDAR